MKMPCGNRVKILRLLRFSLFCLGGTGFFLLVILAVPPRNPAGAADYSREILDRSGRILRVYLDRDSQWHQAPASEDGEPAEVPSPLEAAVLCFEDRRFYRHIGVSPPDLLRAFFQNLRDGYGSAGGSTITMQTARLLDPKPRTIASKFVELFQALKLETLFSKEEILSLYLSNAPYGGNIRGIRSASLRYYRKEPERLTYAESAALAVLPNAPGLISLQTDRASLRKRRNLLLSRMTEQGFLPESLLQTARNEPVPEEERPFPLSAPHLSDRLVSKKPGIKPGLSRSPAVRLRGRSKDPFSTPSRNRIKTTLDRDIQQRLEQLLRFHQQYLERIGAGNIAALAVETESGKVRAYAASQDYFDVPSDGQVDGVRAPRSTGSTLKPFLYALSIEEGLIHPRSLLFDIPTQISSFSPVNSDERFRGLVSAEQALAQSLNVPAARLLDRYGIDRLYFFLKQGGLEHLFRPAADYGIPLVLGGAEAELEELVNLYRMLGNNGMLSPLVYLDTPAGSKNTGSAGRSERVLKPGSAFLTLEMLRNLERPGAELFWEDLAGKKPIAWKTGTSYGFKDAWAIGVTPDWTVGVWVGNFDGSPVPGLSSTSHAAPVMLDIFSLLPDTGGSDWFTPRQGSLEKVKLCLNTGYLAGPDCPESMEAEIPAASPPPPVCPYHEQLLISEDGRYRVRPGCAENRTTRHKAFLIYPPAVLASLRSGGRRPEAPPPWHPNCSPPPGGRGLSILYPEAGSSLWLPRDLDGTLQQLPLRAAHRDEAAELYWYLDGKYLGTSKAPHRFPVRLEEGEHRLLVIGPAGSRAERKFWVGVRRD
ncbi:MAG: penicillin-binding protein 1C [Spirochaetales bacterium]|nr:penicillin-binding protein 1C [Spirochaetales bacterium]MCF7937826.1 penicillin-binding protein 1C [Spirochaetales bacterium]